MRHKDDSLLEVLVEETAQVEHLLPGLRAESLSWLVREEDWRAVREGPPGGAPLLLAAAQLVGAVARTLCHAHELEQLLPAFRTDRGALPREPQRQFDVFFGGERRGQGEELKDETGPRQAGLDQGPRFQSKQGGNA